MFITGMLVLLGLPVKAEEGDPGLGPEAAVLQERVLKLLASPKAVDRAWGAFYAGKHGTRAAAPKLLAMFEKPMDPEAAGEKTVRFYATSALIDLRPEVSDAVLRQILTEKRYTLALALIAGHPDKKEKFLSALLDQDQEKHLPVAVWIAACNMLLQARPAGLATRLIRNTRVRVEVVVRDDARHKGGSLHATMTCGDGRINFGDEYPPVVYHQLTLRPVSGYLVLAPGPENVYLRRRESVARGRLGVGSVSRRFDRDDYRLRCLAELLSRKTENMGVRTDYTVSLRWQGRAHMRDTVAEHVATVLKDWRRLAQDLSDKDLIDAYQIKIAVPTLVFDIRDQRTDKTHPLPPLDVVTSEDKENPGEDVF